MFQFRKKKFISNLEKSTFLLQILVIFFYKKRNQNPYGSFKFIFIMLSWWHVIENATAYTGVQCIENQ